MVVTLSALTHVGRSVALNTFITKVSEVKSTLIVSVKYMRNAQPTEKDDKWTRCKRNTGDTDGRRSYSHVMMIA